MTKTFFTLITKVSLMLLVIAGFAACSDDKEPGGEEGDVTLELSTYSIEFEAEINNDIAIEVTTNSTNDWSYTASNSWITHSKSGNTLTVNAELNEGSQRTGTITFRAGTTEKVVNITQDGLGGNVSLTFDSVAGEYKGVSANGYTGQFELTCTYDDRVLTLIAFDDLFAVPSMFVPTATTYTPGGDSELLTYLVGSVNDIDGFSGSYYKSGSSTIAIIDGDLELAINGSTYTISATLKGEDIDTDEEFTFDIYYNGSIRFNTDVVLDYSDYSSDQDVAYYGDYGYNDGIARTRFRIYSDFEEDGMTFYGFRASSLYSDLVDDLSSLYIPSGTYRIRAEKGKYTIMPGNLGSDNYISGAYDFKGNGFTGGLEDVTLAQYGTMIVENNGTYYSIYGHMAGKNLITEEIQDFAFSLQGSFYIANMIPSESYDLNINDYWTKAARSVYYPDRYGTGSDVFAITLSFYSNDQSGYQIMLEICTPSTTYNSIPAGTYGNNTDYSEYSYIPGYYDEGSIGSYIMVYPAGGGYANRLCYLDEGDIVLDYNSVSNTYSIICEGLIGHDEHTGDIIDISFQYNDFTFRSMTTA